MSSLCTPNCLPRTIQAMLAQLGDPSWTLSSLARVDWVPQRSPPSPDPCDLRRLLRSRQGKRLSLRISVFWNPEGSGRRQVLVKFLVASLRIVARLILEQAQNTSFILSHPFSLV